MAGRRVSAGRPGPELVGVADGPDVGDPVACDLEREHRNGDAVLLGDQAGLAVDRVLPERQARCPAGNFDAGARDLGCELLDGAVGVPLVGRPVPTWAIFVPLIT